MGQWLGNVGVQGMERGQGQGVRVKETSRTPGVDLDLTTSFLSLFSAFFYP